MQYIAQHWTMIYNNDREIWDVIFLPADFSWFIYGKSVALIIGFEAEACKGNLV